MLKKWNFFFKFYGIHIITGILLFAVYYLLNIYVAYYISKWFDIYNFTVLTILVILFDTIVSVFSADILIINPNKLYFLKCLGYWIFGIINALIFFWVMFVVVATLT